MWVEEMEQQKHGVQLQVKALRHTFDMKVKQQGKQAHRQPDWTVINEQVSHD